MKSLALVLLAFVAVGLRNFEEGLKIDGTLYAEISRQIARTGEWFLLQPRIPELNPFYEHPHLGFWLNAFVFKMLPAADWSARISSQLFYLGFLFLFISLVKKWTNSDRAAWISAIFLSLWWPFTIWFRDVYLDPGALFLGVLAIFCCEKKYYFRAGLSLALLTMQKGMTALGFCPVFIFYLIHNFSWKSLGRFFCGFGFLIGIYFLMVKSSHAPDFLNVILKDNFLIALPMSEILRNFCLGKIG